MDIKIITKYQIEKRKYWIDEIRKLSGNFGDDSDRVEQEVVSEIKEDGEKTLIGHLRLCGAIPEDYNHDSSEEKLYSKYTDIIISQAFNNIGITSIVLKERADAADVECITDSYSFVADAKAFRLSRTAKNQKDFKVQAMDNWKRGKPYAMIVSPVYQLPSRTSQIYSQAASRSVLVFSYTHLSVLVRYCGLVGSRRAISLLHKIFQTLDALNPSKNANDYWLAINQTILNFDSKIRSVWLEEKQATIESIFLAKQEALNFLARERERIMKLSREEAIKEVLKASKLDKKIKAVKSVSENGILSIN